MKMSITEIQEHLEEVLNDIRELEAELGEDELSPEVKRVLRLAREGFHDLDDKLSEFAEELEETINEVL